MQYNEDGRSNCWVRINGEITNIPHNIIRIWRTDNNEQIASTIRNKQVIGECAINTEIEHGNGENYPKTCPDSNFICMKTFFRPTN